MSGGEQTLSRDDLTPVPETRDRAPTVPAPAPDGLPDPGDQDPGPYTTDRIHVLRERVTVRRPEGSETD